jgi:nitroimidazol reductase NimA-like FMN-containing flavoprotein (pyridoxamine 5'-phosphate oxidase superfamily)
MSNREHWFPGRLIEMSTVECRDLMGSTSVGRVAFVDEDGPIVLPVNFVLDGGSVLFRTSPHNTVARHIDSALVAFEVDEFDDWTQSGWSVLVRGAAAFVETDEPTRDERPRPDPWVDGVRTLLVRITPTSISGRRLLPG